jgi:hypothetical protein
VCVWTYAVHAPFGWIGSGPYDRDLFILKLLIIIKKCYMGMVCFEARVVLERGIGDVENGACFNVHRLNVPFGLITGSRACNGQ